MIHLISDTHFFHKNICKYSNRPYSSVEEMNDALIKNWNNQVQPDDTVYHLGDFAFCNLSKIQGILSCLNGEKHLILGNHDHEIKKNVNKLVPVYFKSIQDYLEINYNKQLFVLFHFGMRVWHRNHHGSIHLYAHSHGNLPPFGKSVDVGVDCKEITDEYRPVSIEEVLSYMAGRSQVIVDHHGARDAM